MSERAVLPDAGSSDLRAAADALRSRLPEPLAPLAAIAYNYRWSWAPGGPELFAAIDAERWELCLGNPVRLLQEVHPDTLARVAGDAAFLARIAELEQAVGTEGAEPITPAGVTPEHPVAFFCAEYAIHGSLPVYSGGLGVLAGDILKESSDRRVPLVAVGLMYRHGYFRQRIDGSGWQHEYWVDTDPDRVPAALVTGADGTPLTVSVPVAGRDVVAQIWRVDVGRVPLLLLDADRPENSATDRWITSRLYVGDPTVRLWQYALLGVGGVRALHALGVEPSVVHLNEGHAALAGLELARAATADGSVAADEALAAARERTVFTTHTPVPAGNDAYPAGQIAGVLAPLAGDLGIDIESLIGLGRTHPDEPAEPFGVTQFALRTSRTANAVSARHGEVAREMWNDLWPDRSVDEVPIGHVTNGVHIPTWIGAPMRELLDRHLGAGWADRATNPETWAAVDSLPAEELWAARSAQRRELLELVCERSVIDRLGRGDTLEYVRAAAEALDPEALTLGFARRVATYKRLDLLLSAVDRAVALLGNGDRPVQMILAGKAHPRDDDGKRLVQRLFAMKSHPEVSRRVVYLDDYDFRLGAAMTRGCDVWVNVPRPPLEASGTSGMKSAINAGLQLAVLDGWWPEAHDGTNGWAISGEVDHDHGAQDWRHAAELYRLISDEVIPAFYDRDEAGLPQAWLSMVRSSLRACGPRFGAGRMVEDYAARIYPPR
ncbi:MAG TPA: alpha-glucan family phosphorylase [Solirubrobacteraceae bacterium]|nr:alpha-glucan family phosphorylase [Solirubrobacteraceae bacterium]